MRHRLSLPAAFLLMIFGLELINLAVHFPYATDRPISPGERDRAAQEFYRQAYAPSAAPSQQERENEERYVRVAETAAQIYDVRGLVSRYARRYDLSRKRVLDVGAGRGYLQDVVDNYVGLDISPTAQRFFHKSFVLASATAMPFKDNEFDAAWSIWVLEHVPNPESALQEIRRVVKPGGTILLMPAWFCPSWAAEGYPVRRYSDFGIGGKLTKASLLIRASLTYQLSYVIPTRALRYTAARVLSGPTSFHYTRLSPNYGRYWMPDSDAVNSMDPYEVRLWFESRGDRCENWPRGGVFGNQEALVIRIGSKK